MNGICRICGKFNTLTPEHVPPKNANNKTTVVEHSVESGLNKTRGTWKTKQGGVSVRTLCKSCNEITGHWYGGEYKKWAGLVLANQNKAASPSKVSVAIHQAYPLRFLKQIVTSMFSVVNSPDGVFAKRNPELVEFVLNRDETFLPGGFRFFLGLYKDSQNETKLRMYPVAAKFPVKYRKDKTGALLQLSGEPVSVFSEYSHPPFSAIMTQRDGFQGYLEITHFRNYGYYDKTKIVLDLPMRDSFSLLPGT